jgi:hypothetical protein
MRLYSILPTCLWTLTDIVMSLSRRKHGFDSRRARHSVQHSAASGIAPSTVFSSPCLSWLLLRLVNAALATWKRKMTLQVHLIV